MAVLTREQEQQVERIADVHGRVCVRHGYADGAIRCFVPTGQEIHVQPSGVMVDAGRSFDVDWSMES